MAFNAKNLIYDKNEPSFLRKLRGEYGDSDGRHNVQIARPKKDRLKTGDADEDEPVIVDESGEVVQKAEFERRVGGDGGSAKEKVGNGGEEEGIDEAKQPDGTSTEKEERSEKNDKQQIAEIGVGKKRKVGKVIGSEDEAEALPLLKSSKTGTTSKSSTLSKKEESTHGPSTSKIKKKGKKIKLSFDEPEDG